MNILHILLLLSILATSAFSITQQREIEQKIDWLLQRLYQNYWNKDQKYVFPVKWEHLKGIFQSKVHFNFLDHHNMGLAAYMRDQAGVPDINMFVTSFALYGLLQAKALGTIKIDEHKFSESLQAIAGFQDKNLPSGIPQYVFWPQTNINGTYCAYAKNLANSINILPNPPPFLKNILTKIGLGIFAQAKSILKFFVIPADNDDSSVNLALLALMKELKSEHFQFFDSFNTKKQAYYNQALKYAYRPFATDFALNPQADQIDPRTYFVIRGFLDKKKRQSQNPSLILPSTWLLNQDEIVPDRIIMPFRTNNVDASVCANFLFGLTFQILTGGVSLQSSPQLVQMMLDTTQLLQYTVNEILKKRPTLILVYYPSKYDFYWFVSRTVHLLKRHSNSEYMSEPLPEIKERLERLMKKSSTQQIMKSAKASQEQSELHWVQFLGNYGGKQRNEDVVFSTSLALNALLDTWTTRSGNNLSYDEDTPEQVKSAIEKGVNFLLKNLKPGMKEINAFFSGSLKQFADTFPYFFPANHVYDNGTKIDPTELTLKNLTYNTVSTVKGYIEEAQYEQMLHKKWFGSDVPEKQQSLNKGYGASFPFWSSSAIGEIMSITSLSKYLRAIQNEKI